MLFFHCMRLNTEFVSKVVARTFCIESVLYSFLLQQLMSELQQTYHTFFMLSFVACCRLWYVAVYCLLSFVLCCRWFYVVVFCMLSFILCCRSLMPSFVACFLISCVSFFIYSVGVWCQCVAAYMFLAWKHIDLKYSISWHWRVG